MSKWTADCSSTLPEEILLDSDSDQLTDTEDTEKQTENGYYPNYEKDDGKKCPDDETILQNYGHLIERVRLQKGFQIDQLLNFKPEDCKCADCAECDESGQSKRPKLDTAQNESTDPDKTELNVKAFETPSQPSSTHMAEQKVPIKTSPQILPPTIKPKVISISSLTPTVVGPVPQVGQVMPTKRLPASLKTTLKTARQTDTTPIINMFKAMERGNVCKANKLVVIKQVAVNGKVKYVPTATFKVMPKRSLHRACKKPAPVDKAQIEAPKRILKVITINDDNKNKIKETSDSSQQSVLQEVKVVPAIPAPNPEISIDTLPEVEKLENNSLNDDSPNVTSQSTSSLDLKLADTKELENEQPKEAKEGGDEPTIEEVNLHEMMSTINEDSLATLSKEALDEIAINPVESFGKSLKQSSIDNSSNDLPIDDDSVFHLNSNDTTSIKAISELPKLHSKSRRFKKSKWPDVYNYDAKPLLVAVYIKCPEDNCTQLFHAKANNGLSTNYHYQIERHIRKVHNIPVPNRCLACEKRIPVRLMARHFSQEHKDQQKWECIKCPKDFPTYSSLAKHFCLCHSEGQFRCAIADCNFIGSFRIDIYRHNSNDHRQHKCDFPGCEVTFKYPSSLKRHKNIHLGLKPYRCRWEGCTFGADLKGIAVYHVRAKHLGLPMTRKEQNKRQIVCTINPEDYVELVKQQDCEII